MYRRSRIEPLNPAGRICTLCEQFKPNTEFSNNLLTRDGKYSQCKTCKAARTRRNKHHHNLLETRQAWRQEPKPWLHNPPLPLGDLSRMDYLSKYLSDLCNSPIWDLPVPSKCITAASGRSSSELPRKLTTVVKE